MDAGPSAQITGLLKAWAGGDRVALERFTPMVYAGLRRIAGRYMAKERPGNSLQATALVNEVFLRLVEVEDVRWQDRVHFFAIWAQTMRRGPASRRNAAAPWSRWNSTNPSTPCRITAANW